MPKAASHPLPRRSTPTLDPIASHDLSSQAKRYVGSFSAFGAPNHPICRLRGRSLGVLLRFTRQRQHLYGSGRGNLCRGELSARGSKHRSNGCIHLFSLARSDATCRLIGGGNGPSLCAGKSGGARAGSDSSFLRSAWSVPRSSSRNRVSPDAVTQGKASLYRGAKSCGLTPPSSGRSKGRFAPFGPPLMSNVRCLVLPLLDVSCSAGEACLLSGMRSGFSLRQRDAWPHAVATGATRAARQRRRQRRFALANRTAAFGACGQARLRVASSRPSALLFEQAAPNSAVKRTSYRRLRRP